MFCKVVAFILLLCGSAIAQTNPIVFVTQLPIPNDFATINSTFANHLPDIKARSAGGDLWIRYPDGTLRNLTREAGYGVAGQQGATSIVVRDPSVHWGGAKILFSMVVGAPSKQYEVNNGYRWQLFEISGIGRNDTPVIMKVPHQPAEYNNVMPTYGTDDKILFVSDRPRGGERHLYPQRDEYESTPTNTGVWRLDPKNGSLTLLDHAPSGDFHPNIDSFGRVLFTRWDHLQSDQQAGNNRGFGAFNYLSEASSARTESREEFFPELQDPEEQAAKNSSVNHHQMNLFLPWMMNEDGTGIETLNHIGRHELRGYLSRSFKNDPNVVDYTGQYYRLNKNSVNNFFQIKEDVARPGNYYGIDAPEFGTHASGQIISIKGAPGVTADKMVVTYVTHRATASVSDSPSADHSGFYRDPLPLTDGELLAVHTSTTQADAHVGVSGEPRSRYEFRIKRLVRDGSGHMRADAPLTPGIRATISYWDPDTLLQFKDVVMWELQPVEVVSRPRPAPVEASLESPELSILSQLQISVSTLRDYLIKNDLALVISRDVTTRDSSDLQQPFNLRVAGTRTQTVSAPGKVYDISHLQFFQGDLVRGYGGIARPEPGRRVLARPMSGVSNGAVKIGNDGSMAALVPARRALTWQLLSPSGDPVVRERVWLTFAAGEIRICASCHGINGSSQVGKAAPTNAPQALRELLKGLELKRIPQGVPTSPSATPAPSNTPEAPSREVQKAAGYSLLRRGRGSLKGGSVLELIARGPVGARLSLRLSVNGKSCSRSLLRFELKRRGAYRFRRVLPSLASDARLRFSLHDGSRSAVAGYTVRVKRGGEGESDLCSALGIKRIA